MPLILWEGPSLLDGQQIVVLGVPDSQNEKTGPVLAVSYLRQDIAPHEAVKQGKDASICGDCPLRGGACYVVPFMGPRQTWQSWKDGKAQPMNLARAAHRRIVRHGAYGDPACVPTAVTAELSAHSAGWLGYTSQWRTCDPDLKRYLMASVQTMEQARHAQDAGWKTFRIKDPLEGKVRGERICPAQRHLDNGVRCVDCLACNGNGRSFVVDVHGAVNKKAAYRRVRLELAA